MRRRPAGRVNATPGAPALAVCWLGRRGYLATWQAMRDFSRSRGPRAPDWIWMLEHPPVFTLGQAGRSEHLLHPADIAVVQSDRGGQVTYHGPGQLIAYVLLDMRRSAIGVRDLVRALEQAVIELAAGRGIEAARRPGAPGVYVGDAKLAALGLRVRNRCSYHGLALNVDLDLEPFSRIDPCGYPGLRTTRLRDLGVAWSVREAGTHLAGALGRSLGRSPVWHEPPPEAGN